MKIPDGHQRVMPYLILDGAGKFIEFTANVFGAREQTKNKAMRDETTVMHAEISIGGVTIMLADSTEKFQARTTSLFIYVENADETYQKAIAAGATTLMGLSDQEYGRTCGVTDPFGNIWWITSVS